MKRPKRKQTQATTSEFHEGTPLVPEELCPLLDLPVMVRDSEGRRVPNYSRERLSPWLRTVSLLAKSFLDEQARSKAESARVLMATEEKLVWEPTKALKIDDLLHKADDEPAVFKDALAALWHADNLQEGIRVLKAGGPSDAHTWFYFGVIGGLYLGEATARLDSLARHEPDTRRGKALHRGESTGGMKTAERRWGPTKPERERRNTWWRSCDEWLRKTQPKLSAAKRYEIIAKKSKDNGFAGSSTKNIALVLREHHHG
jgi:hypothetical protein